MRTINLFKILLLLGLFGLFTACSDDDDNNVTNLPADDDDPVAEVGTIAGIATSSEDFTSLVTALQAANLVETFDSPGDYTVFAPTDGAFANLLSANNGISSFDDISAEGLDVLLKHHVVAGRVFSSDLSDGQMVETLAGTMLEVDITDGVVTVGGAQVSAVDIEASNGVIHVLSDVMVTTKALTIAQVAISNPDFSTLVAALSQADLVAPFTDSDGEFTVFAPTNAAFEAAGITDLSAIDNMDLARILKHHVVGTVALSSSLSEGQMIPTLANTKLPVSLANGVTVGGGNVVAADIETVNGVIHVVGTVLLPNTIVDVARDAGSFTSLLGALSDTELTDLFNFDGDEAYTVFAPNDAAFAAISDVLPTLTTEEIARILAHHVVPSKIMEGDLSEGAMVTTLAGTKLTVSLMGGATINGVDIVATDVEASNGVIHVIDEVLLPNTIVDVAKANGSFTTLLGALDATDLTSTFNMDGGEYTVFAPTDDAFAKIADTVEGLSTEELANVLAHHVVATKALSTDLSDGQMIETLAGTMLTVTVMGESVYIDGVMVQIANVEASNGVIHVLGDVLIPSSNSN
ncbi:fasciclin domain-containing protein [Flammeovirga sp. MY04]|uniref:fasciclin domain-containing protein n=1 Tax=Flammeovirga sp. MY04 TaxID=1191459 RepID=UPI00080627A9|nr:fasciclin domain-containing protein [Flammeovirga sp. MY04]ANQ52696.1 fasciclin domain-containing protein [Flammeovirga sp. MY04]